MFDKKIKETNIKEEEINLVGEDKYAGLNESQIAHLKRMEEAEK